MSDKAIVETQGGQFNGLFTGGNVETLIYSGAGRVAQITITTAGTAAFSIYDGTQSTGGTLMYTSITNDTNGTQKKLDLPVGTGIVVKGTTGAAGVLVSYNKGGKFGLA